MKLRPTNDKPEILAGDDRHAALANEICVAIEKACESQGIDLDIACCIVANVVADYARGNYGNEFLSKVAAVVLKRGSMPMPARVN